MTEQQTTTVHVNGDRIRKNLDKSIKELELLGIHEKIALQAFKENSGAEKAVVTYNGKQSTQWRADLESMPSTKEVL